jgi:uncharacterized membrane protein
MKTSSKSTAVCQICKKEKKLNELMPGISIPNSIVDLITQNNYKWDPEGFICFDDLNKFRSEFVHGILTEEKGTLSEFEKEVLDSIVERDILSRDVDESYETKASWGEKLSDKIARFGGSWPFIIIFLVFILVWMMINVVFLAKQSFDPYPFILLNLVLSCIAAIQAPVIMMSQNRQESKDRVRSMHDYQVNLKAEVEIRRLHDKMDHLLKQQGMRMLEIQQIQMEMMEEISKNMKK